MAPWPRGALGRWGGVLVVVALGASLVTLLSSRDVRGAVRRGWAGALGGGGGDGDGGDGRAAVTYEEGAAASSVHARTATAATETAAGETARRGERDGEACPTVRVETQTEEAGRGREVGGAARGDEPIAKTHALFTLDDPVAQRQFTLDYYRGVEERQAMFPNQNFVFALQINYPPFMIRAPNVDEPGDLAVWASKPHQSQYLAEAAAWCAGSGGSESALARRICAERGRYDLVYFQHPYVSGSIDVFDHVSVGPHECGWMATPKIATPLGATDQTPQYDKLASLDVPEGCAFQHFLDGVLPKIVAALPVIRDPDVKLWIPACGHGDMVMQLYDHLGIDRSRLVNVHQQVSVRRFYSVCDIPGWNPILWRQMHHVLGAAVDRPAAERTRIIYLPRGNDAHNGRPVDNDADVQNAVRAVAQRHGFEYVAFDRAQVPKVADVLALFGGARLIVGMHGGAFYNMMFAPAGIDVVEFIPSSVTFFLFHIMAEMLGDHHWFLPTQGGQIPIDKLTRILERALGAAPKAA